MKGRLSRRLYLRISVGAVILTLAPRSANAFTLRVGGTLGEWGRKVSDNWKKSDPGKAGIRYQKWVNRTTDKAKRELKQLFNRTFRSGFIEPPTIIPCGSGSLAPAYFVNGVRNTRNDAVVAATALSIHLDRQILLIHNPTTGWVDDLIECFFDRIWVYPLPVSNKTTRQLASVF